MKISRNKGETTMKSESTSVNAIINKADVHFFPELGQNQIELTLLYDRGRALFRTPMNSDSMYRLLNLFGKDSLYDLQGQYCRLYLDDSTSRVDGIANIIHDEFGWMQDNPIA